MDVQNPQEISYDAAGVDLDASVKGLLAQAAAVRLPHQTVDISPHTGGSYLLKPVRVLSSWPQASAQLTRDARPMQLRTLPHARPSDPAVWARVLRDHERDQMQRMGGFSRRAWAQVNRQHQLVAATVGASNPAFRKTSAFGLRANPQNDQSFDRKQAFSTALRFRGPNAYNALKLSAPAQQMHLSPAVQLDAEQVKQVVSASVVQTPGMAPRPNFARHAGLKLIGTKPVLDEAPQPKPVAKRPENVVPISSHRRYRSYFPALNL